LGQLAATSELDATDAILCFLTFTLTESLGASLINHPATITHASIPKEEWEALEITDSLLRLSVCIEKANDIDQALKNLNAGRICALSP
jgi:cystathionine beta-lyase/cystathionine gamma-synthase